MTIQLDDFVPISATFELRYPTQFLVWDRSGSIWSRMSTHYPGISQKQAQPNAVAVNLEPNLDAAIAIDRAYVVATKFGDKLAALKGAASNMTMLLGDFLTIENYSRIGLRIIFQKRFGTREAAADYLFEVAPLPYPRERVLNVEGTPREATYNLRHEGETLGFQLRVSAAQTQINAEFPAEFNHVAPAQEDLTVNRVMVDIDYYSHAQVSVDQLNAADLIENWYRVIRRDISHVLS